MGKLDLSKPADARRYARNMIADINVNRASYKRYVIAQIRKLKALSPNDRKKLLAEANRIKAGSALAD